jgi:hypothetical protein
MMGVHHGDGIFRNHACVLSAAQNRKSSPRDDRDVVDASFIDLVVIVQPLNTCESPEVLIHAGDDATPPVMRRKSAPDTLRRPDARARIGKMLHQEEAARIADDAMELCRWIRFRSTYISSPAHG